LKKKGREDEERDPGLLMGRKEVTFILLKIVKKKFVSYSSLPSFFDN
jgi:hypothetical protein